MCVHLLTQIGKWDSVFFLLLSIFSFVRFFTDCDEGAEDHCWNAENTKKTFVSYKKQSSVMIPFTLKTILNLLQSNLVLTGHVEEGFED